MKDNWRLSYIFIDWYSKNKRDLPWRETSDPYVIWLSEIILQQTRVAQGYDYFLRFAARFPSVADLAAASEDEVLKLWQGLGYYSRARNLHASSKMIVERYNGIFPHRYKDILALKGVGEYTAAAIASFAYNEPHAVVDGNVYRVLSRIFAIDNAIDTTLGKKVFSQLADILLNREYPGLHNQAIMEFGALQCVPVSPNCNNCPAVDVCMAYAKKGVGEYPKKQGKQRVRNRYFNYFYIQIGECTYLQKREAKDIWQNLHEFPLIETDRELSVDELRQSKEFQFLFDNQYFVEIKSIERMKHILSHQIIYATFFKIKIEKDIIESSFIKVLVNDVSKYAVSRLVDKYLERDS